MEIQELFLQHYGKFENHRILLNPGINIISGGNESGKTTIHSFVRAMLFGLNRGRGKAARYDEYQLRQPWDAPGAFLGSMKVKCRGQVYRIDRCFDRSAQPLRVTCETTLWESPQPEQALEVLLGGVSEAAFSSTLCIPQSGGETGEALAQELRRYMINSESTSEGQMDVSLVLQNLRRRKKQMEQQKKKEDSAMEADIAKKQARAEQLRGEIRLLREQAARSSYPAGGQAVPAAGREGRRLPAAVPAGGEPARAAGSYADKTEGGWQREEDRRFYRRMKWLMRFLLLLTGVLSLAAACFLERTGIRIALGACGVLFLALIVPAGVLFRPGEEEEEDGSDRMSQGEMRGRAAWEDGPEQSERALGYRRQQDYLSEELDRREAAYQKLQDDLEALYRSHVKLNGLDTEIAAVTLAIDRICDLSSGIYAKSGRQLNERASEILAELTQGRYSRILLDEASEVRIHTPSRVLGLSQVSGGTMQQIYFALRMASAELLCGERRLPILLDEPFAMYDDARLEAALLWLRKCGRQVILFTCQKREREILERLGD